MDASHRQAEFVAHFSLKSDNKLTSQYYLKLFPLNAATAYDCWIKSSGLVWGINAQLIATWSNQLTPSWKTAAPTCAS
jgi:hypothetical protein